MKLLITGGAGFIGSNFIRYWFKKYPSDKIINLDKLTYAANLASTADFSQNKNYQFVQGDIVEAKLVNRLMPGVDFVVNFAAESHVDRSISRPAIFVRTNVLGTEVLLEASLRHKVKRFHHVSTDEVFGSLPEGSKQKFNQGTPYQPRNPYAASKAAADHLVRVYFQTYGLAVTITNCSNNFGPYQHPEKFLPRMITHLLLKKKIPIYGDGLYVRDWLYVEDHSRAIDLVLARGRFGETYLVGGQRQGITNLQIAKRLLNIFGFQDDWLEFVADRPGHDRRYAVDWSKIRKELGWQPRYDFYPWLKKTVAWYKKNKEWWAPLKGKAEAFYRSRRV